LHKNRIMDTLTIHYGIQSNGFQGEKVMCSGVDLSEFYNNFSDFPRIEH
jgi:hypothetical protein